MLGGEEYPSTAIGINLPNADWIRAQYGSKSITISNITDAYNKASHGSGFREEFIKDKEILGLIESMPTFVMTCIQTFTSVWVMEVDSCCLV